MASGSITSMKIKTAGFAVPNDSDVTYTLSGNYAFMVQIFRANSTSTGYNGLYIGQGHNNGSIKEILASSAIATMSISGKVITMRASSGVSNVNAKIIEFID